MGLLVQECLDFVFQPLKTRQKNGGGNHSKQYSIESGKMRDNILSRIPGVGIPVSFQFETERTERSDLNGMRRKPNERRKKCINF